MADLQQLKEIFDLRHSQKDFVLSSMVKSIALYLTVQLENTMSDRLKGYGPVPPQLENSLDAKLREMISLLYEINSMVGSGSSLNVEVARKDSES